MKPLKLMNLRNITLLVGLAIIPQSAFAQQSLCASYNQEFKVYFDNDSVAVGNIVHKIIDQSRKNMSSAVHCKIEFVTVTGHTDRHGSVQKNKALSIAMAYSIRDLFMERGVPEKNIKVYGKGETKPIITTDDNVAEARNRRVEIKVSITDR